MKDQILGAAQPERMPLGMLLDKISLDLYAVLAGNGYKQIGFAIVAHATDVGEGAASGNLNSKGLRALLEDCLAQMDRMEAEETPPIVQ